MFTYHLPTNINFGKDCLARLTEVIKYCLVKKILIFTGSESAKISGALEEVKDALSGYRLIFLTGTKPNPTIGSLAKGIRLCQKEKVDLIIGIGGGSVIDYGKAVSVLSKERHKFSDFFYNKHKLKGAKIKFIAVPTTFGTSSEVTPYAVMTDAAEGIKITLTNESMFPNWAFTDPKFTLTMPRQLVASSCADLFSHAVEAYWSINATELTDNFATGAIKLFLQYYKQTYQKPGDLEVRERISLAGLYAGLAFSNTRTTACHSISYPMTVIFKIPHGIACILTLSEMLEFNSKTSKNKIQKLCNVMNCSNVKNAKKKIGLILNQLNIKTHLADYGLTKDNLKIILKKSFTPERVALNPRRLTRRDLKELLERIY